MSEPRLMTEPHDGHEPEATCPGCPHTAVSGEEAQALTAALAKVLGETLEREGGGPGSSIHSWRCEYPDRYGPCDCVMGVAREQAADLAPVVAEHVAGERAAALREAAERMEHDMALAWGGDAAWLTTGTRVASLVAEVLREGVTDREAQP